MQTDSVVEVTTLNFREVANPGDLGGNSGRRLTPGEIRIRVTRCDGSGRRRRSTEEDGRYRIRNALQRSLFHVDVLAGEINRTVTGPQLADHVEELAASCVPLVLVEEVTERALLVVLPAGHDVEQQTTTRLPLEGSGHLSGQRRAEQSRSQSNQKLERLGGLDHHRCRQPCVFAPRAGGCENGLEAVRLGGRADLIEVFQRRRTITGHRAAVPTRHQIPGITVSRQEPVEAQ